MAQLICPNCGKEMANLSEPCPACGHKIGEVSEEPADKKASTEFSMATTGKAIKILGVVLTVVFIILALFISWLFILPGIFIGVFFVGLGSIILALDKLIDNTQKLLEKE